MRLGEDLTQYLEDLERRIDPVVEQRLWGDWMDFTSGRYRSGMFLPARISARPPEVEWPSVTVNSALEDVEAMAIHQYASCSQILDDASGALMCVRANYGPSILPALFGVELFMMDDSLDTLPTSWPVAGGVDGLKSLLDNGIPDLRNSLGGKALQAAEMFAEIGGKYPLIGEFIHIYHPDTQGPMDACELLVGSELFTIIYDQPDLVKDLLDLVTQTYVAYMKEYYKIVPHKIDHAVHWHMLHKGCIMLRDDSATNFSPTMYEEFIRPYDQRLLDEFGGGGIHFCGRGDHYIEKMSQMTGLYAIAMSQPHLNDMERIYANTVDKGIQLIGFAEEHARAALKSGRDLRGRVQSFRC